MAGSTISSRYDIIMGELVEQQNWLLCAVMTLCNQADVCTSAADSSDIIRNHVSHLQARCKLLSVVCLERCNWEDRGIVSSCMMYILAVLLCVDTVG